MNLQDAARELIKFTGSEKKGIRLKSWSSERWIAPTQSPNNEFLYTNEDSVHYFTPAEFACDEWEICDVLYEDATVFVAPKKIEFGKFDSSCTGNIKERSK